VFAAWEGNGRLQARTLRNRLLEATTAEAPAVVKDMAPYRRWVDSLLKESYAQAKASGDARKQLHTSFALLPIDPAQADYLYERMLTGEPLELVMIREALLDHQFDLTGRLWAMLEDPKNDQDRRFRAACALAAFAPDDPRWEKTAPDVAATLVIQKPFAISPWTDALKRSARWLIPPLAGFLVDEHRSVSERGLIASVYGKFAAEVPDAYTRLEAQLEETGAADATIDAKIGLAKKKASVGAAFLVMGRGEKAWPLLKHAPDPTMRSTLIERLAPAGVDHKLLLARLDDEKDGSIKRALLLSLGEYGLDRLAPAERRNHLARMLDLYRDATDSGIHSAAGRLLSLWGAVAELMVIDTSLATGKTEGKRQWYINRQNQTMVMIAKPEEFWMGGRQRDETRHRRRIGRGFAISSKEVTVDQFRQFRKDHNYSKQFAPTGDCPVTEVSWYDAAAYCNWLSEQEGVAKDQWCYLPNESGEYAAGMKLAPDYLRRTGYRLPTEAEWEYACRSGTESEFSSGEDAELLNRYAWFDQNSFSKSHPAGSLKSNDFGLWDMHGNVLEWVQDSYQPHPAGGVGEALGDKEEMLLAISDNESRVLRGGSFNLPASLVRSSCRNFNVPSVRPNSGFRLSRTFTP
jgi:formylglycine-generating enzyme required for sulfatase activity